MVSSLDSFINQWLYDVEHILRLQLQALSGDLESEDAHTRERATAEACEILDWLCLPPEPLTDEEKLRRTRDALKDESISLQERLTAARRAARSTGRRRGRPRTDTAQHAIRGLTLRLATPKSWREIALTVKGCNHRRPNPKERSCHACGEAIRDAVGRLEKFLHSKGYHPQFPRRADIAQMSPSELQRLVGNRPPAKLGK